MTTRFTAILIFSLFISCTSTFEKEAKKKLNVLFLTSDDLNFDSIGAYDSKVKNTTPNVDSLAKKGMLFERAYVQSPSCCPSRNVFHTGHYSHNSGVEGFFSADFPQATLPEALRKNGYYTGVIQKVIDMTPTNNTDKYWDFVADFGKDASRTPSNYQNAFDELLSKAKESGKPFFL